MNNDLIYGKDRTPKIVGAEVNDQTLVIYQADGDKTTTISRPFYYYVLLEEPDRSRDCGRLAGRNDFQYFTKFEDKQEMYEYCRSLGFRNQKFWRCYNPVESAMLREGFTFYKDMQLNQVSCLSFDIETTGVAINENSFVLLISNTYRSRSGAITRRLFAFDDYDNISDFINDWCRWVRDVNPDIMLGHNIFGFDFPYLHNFAKLNKTKICLGRNASAIEIDRNPRQFRKDGSQTYDYNNVKIFGREVIDTMFLSIKYDIARNYDSYGLKAIIRHEGLEKENRQHWDFSKNKEPWYNPADWAKFKQYAIDDADDALALFDLMAPQYFYYAQSIPKPFQEIINTATGSQVNSFMCRAYLQDSKAIPAPSDRQEYEGAISYGNPGIYQNVFKLDVASLYPSIMLEYGVTDLRKDPDNRFLEAVRFFTEQRLEDKRLAQETGERIYKDLSNGRKIMINSFYGFMGAAGLNFNFPKGAAEVTRRGREILNKAIEWAQGNSYQIVNVDTDSISYTSNGKSTIESDLVALNALYPTSIRWENDGVYDSVVVVKAKNYALKQGSKIKIKGSGLKATMKERALTEFLDTALNILLDNSIIGKEEELERLYMRLVREIGNVTDISRWSSKKTITKAVLEPKRTNEARVLEALGGRLVQEGDKVRMFFETPTKLCLDSDFKGIYDKDKLYEKLFKTVEVLDSVVPIQLFPNFKLKKNKKLLESLWQN